MRLLYWVHHTGEYDGATGVQRVVRNLAAALVKAGHEVVPVRWDEEREAIVHAERRWTDGLARHGGPVLPAGDEPGAQVHLAADRGLLEGTWLLLPEVPHVAGDGAPEPAVVLDYARFHGLRTAAVFYDLIPLRRAGYESMVPAHQRYARALVAADVLLAISAASAEDLRRWWDEHGYDARRLPAVLALPLPEQVLGLARITQAADPAGPPVRLLSVGTVEPRKNQLEVVRALGRLRARRPDLDVRLDLVGSVHGAVAEELQALVARDDRIILHRYLPDEQVRALVAAAHATVFVSLEEGYGLPVAESMWQGRPCLTSDHGSMAEIAAGGGCLTVRSDDPADVERGLEQIIDDADLRARLTHEAVTRPLRTWADYAAETVEALRAASVPARVVLLEGSRSGAAAATILEAAGVRVHRLRWHAGSRALVPVGAGSVPAPGDGDLRGRWALLALGSCAGYDEMREVLDNAAALGLRVALEADERAPASVLAVPNLVLLPDAAALERVRARLLRELPKTVGLRHRLRVGTGAAALRIIDEVRDRTAAAGAPARPATVYYWAGLTAEQPFNTGIQRVVRRLAAALQRAGVHVVPVGWDAARGGMTVVGPAGQDALARWGGPEPVGPEHLPGDLRGQWLLLPEITVPVVPPGSDVARLARSLGMRCAAIFYDLIPDKLPELYPPGAVDNMRSFWRTFGSADLALPISWTAAADLVRYARAQGLRLPDVVPCPLAADAGGDAQRREAARPFADGEPLRLLAVGTWEPRKNYPRLLRALGVAQARASRPLSLTLVGRRAGYEALDREVETLVAQTGTRVLDAVDDAELSRQYAEAHATVFASWEEGFGLPVVESLWHGRPCVAHDGSAMAELVPGGGVLAADVLDEQALADALVRLADDLALLARLEQEAAQRHLRTWDEYAEDVVRALARTAAAPGWPLPALVRRAPLLSCSITTYNRAPWLEHSLPRLLEATRPYRDVLEVVVCDNTSTDATPDVVAQFRGEPGFSTHRNPVNVGMLGNLGVTAQHSRGAFIWLLGDDDLLVDGAVENVLEGLARHPEVEMAYLNYSYTSFDDPSSLSDPAPVIAAATPIAEGGPNRRVDALREVAGLNENLFTAIYACVFRRDHALRGYQLDTRGAPFSSLHTCVPSSVYALAALQDRPAWWVGEPALVVNMNVSWLRWALLWHLERMPDLFEEAELRGVDPERLDQYRLQHLAAAADWVRATYFEAEDAIREGFSMARLLERCKHLPEFRRRHLPGVRAAYAAAYEAGRVVVDPVPPDELFARYGL